MESAPLTLAHDHARAASVATQTADTTVAINQHTLAAGEFARAAGGTGNKEAFRTLKLLEGHHQKLSQLLKFSTENPVVDATSEKAVAASAAVSELRSPTKDVGQSSPRRTPVTPASLQIPRRMPPRDMSSSIASNLASARGIRSSNNRRALSPSVSTQQAPGSLEVPSRKNSRQPPPPDAMPEQVHSKPSWTPPMSKSQSKADSEVLTTAASPSAAEEGFHRFYSTVENLLSKLSAPLAYAGLPLISEEPSITPESAKTKDALQKSKYTSSRNTTGEPDLSKFISRAALRASAHPTQGGDSFYVVPTTGHTVSYANILSFAEKEKRRIAASMHSADPGMFEDPDNDDFVDAHETVPASPSFKKTGGRGKLSGIKELENVVEELYTENKSLKDCIDQLSKRLHAFEMSAQQSSLALQESMRMIRPSSPAPTPSAIKGGEELEAKMSWKIKSLEEQVESGEKEMRKLAKENEKLQTVVARYRDRWEKLKEGAKTRREAPKDAKGGDGKDEGGGRVPAG